MKRPLVPVALLYVGGLLLTYLVPLAPWLLLAVGLGLAALALAWPRARPMLLYPLILVAGAANLALHTGALSPHDLRLILGTEAHLVTVRGRLRETPAHRVYEKNDQPAWRTVGQLEVTALCTNGGAWQPATGRVAVTTPGMLTNLFGGQQVEVAGVVAPPKGAAAEGLFSYRAYLKELEIYYQVQVESEADWRIISGPKRAPLPDRFRAWGREVLTRGLPGEDESLRLEWALTLGWKPALTEAVSEPFVQAATYHIFAVDGLRMAIVFGIFFGLFRAFGMPRPICGALLIPVIWFYVALTGWPASAIRATVMLTVVIVGWVLKRPSDLLNSLFAAAVIILVWEPQQLFQAGFQLSFFVVLCMILVLTPLRAWLLRLNAPDPLLPPSLRPRWPALIILPGNYARDLLLTSFAAWVGSIPLVAYYFNIVTPVSTPANLLAVPLCGFVLMSNLGSLILAGWLPGMAELFNHAGWFLMECIRVSSIWFAKWPAAYFYVPAPTMLSTGLYYFIVLGLATGWLFKPGRYWWKPALVVVLVACWCWQSWQAGSKLTLTVLPLGGGHVIYVDAPGRRNDLLIDTGSTNAVAFTTKNFLRAQGVNYLPTMVLSHGDLGHVGGALMTDQLFPARQVCASPVRFRSSMYRRSVAEFSEQPEKLRRVSRDERIGAWAVLHPEATDRFSQADDNALVLLAALRGTRVLLVSDLGSAGQNALIERMPELRADIVVTGLPVKGEALSDALLDLVQPRLVVVADSEFPAPGRAGAALKERLARRAVPVLYTRSEGTVTFEFASRGWTVRTMSGRHEKN